MINRNIAPPSEQITDLEYLQPEHRELSNGLKLWELNVGSQELVKIDFIFEAGTWYQPANLVAGLTNAFLNQGTQNYTAQEIAEIFDFHGAYLQLSADQQFAEVTILTLNKYIDTILKVTAEVIQHPTFPEKEILAQIGKKKQQFIIENNKVKSLAHKKFSQVLFGEEHPYANTNKIGDYDALSKEQFVYFHKKYYQPANCKVIVAGHYGSEVLNTIEKYFGEKMWGRGYEVPPEKHIITSSPEFKHFVEKPDALQSALRMGQLMPNRDHVDFHGLNVLTTILGGYFGSRLMTNIREEKGYTYGIGASIYTMPNAAYFSISAEVGNDVRNAAITEIYSEIERLKNELIGEEELEVVRSYLLGENLRNFDGVFAMSGSLRTLIEAGLEYDHFTQFVDITRNITAQELQQLAKKYFDVNKIFEVIAGKK